MVRRRNLALARLIEAAAALGLARLAVTVLPFRLSAHWFGLTSAKMTAGVELGDNVVDPAVIEQVRWSIAAVTARLPGTSTCLAGAFAALMVQRCRTPAALYRGVTLTAHAWLTSGGLIVTGARQQPLYRPIAVFRTRSGR